MSIFKCKMCGGTIEFEPGATVGVCDSCGTRQTLPRLDDDKKTNLYDRANHFRRNNDFDKAMAIYEQILNEDNTDAEAYWSLVLCRYGIEYVEDPQSHKRIPTVNRAQFTSVFADEDYKSALQYADSYQRSIYEEEARAIDDIQKGILAISQKEEPFDIFICYKETDANGRRTQDSVLATDLYHQLTQEGFKVFFSRITLEDKLGIAYEPYIFAALNSAKVTVALGTKPEYFNAVWVKNEWSRYLALVKKSGGKKVLIPAYRDMDPYDLPEEFSHLQAQDMSKLGFMQDLIRGIKKITTATDTPTATIKETIVSDSTVHIAPLLKRAFMFLEDGNWEEADAYCEKVLDQDPENAQAYLGKLMAELRVRRQEELQNCQQPFNANNNYRKAVRFGGDRMSSVLNGYITHINERNENARLTDIYNSSVNAMSAATSETEFKSVAETFRTIPGFKDADSLAGQCLDKAEICRKDAIYSSGKSLMTGKAVSYYEAAINTFRTISGWKDADEQIAACQRKITKIKRRAKISAEITTSIIIVFVAVSIVWILWTTTVSPKQKLNKAMKLLDSGDYDSAYALLEELGKSDVIAAHKYNEALTLMNSGDFEAALPLLEGLSYRDSEDKYILAKAKYQQSLIKTAQVGDTVLFGSYEQDNNRSNGKEDIEWLILAKDGHQALVISKYALDCQPYNTSYTAVTWETCSLRRWLNETFIGNALSPSQQKMIQSTIIKADKNPSYGTSPGHDTTDKVFLLSIPEVNSYFDSQTARECEPTSYAVALGTYIDREENKCTWWLRSPGRDPDLAATIISNGWVREYGDTTGSLIVAVRPAMWINLDA